MIKFNNYIYTNSGWSYSNYAYFSGTINRLGDIDMGMYYNMLYKYESKTDYIVRGNILR